MIWVAHLWHFGKVCKGKGWKTLLINGKYLQYTHTHLYSCASENSLFNFHKVIELSKYPFCWKISFLPTQDEVKYAIYVPDNSKWGQAAREHRAQWLKEKETFNFKVQSVSYSLVLYWNFSTKFHIYLCKNGFLLLYW